MSDKADVKTDLADRYDIERKLGAGGNRSRRRFLLVWLCWSVGPEDVPDNGAVLRGISLRIDLL